MMRLFGSATSLVLLLSTLSLTAGEDFSYSASHSSGHFDGRDLTDANFQYSVLSDAHFDGANLSNADLAYSVASDARFTDAVCRGTRFDYCVLAVADFSGADLRGASLVHTCLRYSQFSKQTIYDETTRFPEGFDPVVRGLTLYSPQQENEAQELLQVAIDHLESAAFEYSKTRAGATAKEILSRAVEVLRQRALEERLGEMHQPANPDEANHDPAIPRDGEVDDYFE